MTEARVRFEANMQEADSCFHVFDALGYPFALRHVWVLSVSAFDLYMTEVVSEAGLRLIGLSPPVLTPNLRQVQVPLADVLTVSDLSPTERLLFYKEKVYSAVQYTSFYRPEKVSEALSYIWTSPAKEKWARILLRMRDSGRYSERTEQDIRGELTQIGDRRDLIAHSADQPPGVSTKNPVDRNDASQVATFISDLATAIDEETESQLT